MRLRLGLTHLAYRVAWRLLWLTAPVHHGRGRGVKALLSHDGRVLLVQHTYGGKRWELPGGGVHRHESPLDGVRREVREELGIEVAEPRLIAYGCGSGHHYKRVISIFAAELADARVVPDPGEIARAQWFEADDLPSPLGWQVAAALATWSGGDATTPVELPV